MILFTASNIKADIIYSLRLKLEEAGNTIMFMKNSLARKALDLRANEWQGEKSPIADMYEGGRPEKPGWEKLSDMFKRVDGCIFANGNLGQVAELIEEHTLASNG